MKRLIWVIPNLLLFIVSIILVVLYKNNNITLEFMKSYNTVALVLAVILACVCNSLNKEILNLEVKQYKIIFIVLTVFLLLGLIPSIMFYNKESDFPLLFNTCYFTFLTIFIPLLRRR